MTLWTNSMLRRDYLRHDIEDMAEEGSDVFIASAFFTESDLIERYVARKCTVRIVVRLGYPTSPTALIKLLRYKQVQVRYYASRRFHPKLYIFGGKIALVGSANLTGAALFENQEVVVSVEGDDPRLDALNATFSAYWKDAEPLTEEALDEYRSIYAAHKIIAAKEHEMEMAVERAFGNAGPSAMDFRDLPSEAKRTFFCRHTDASTRIARSHFPRSGKSTNRLDDAK